MNCANHPDVVAAAYCQNCGKPLCSACVRSVGGVVYCEPCLAARLSPGGFPPAGANFAGYHAHPLLAGLLGFIPGVGAMYNGQFVKALAHVLIFAVFVSLSDKSLIFGLLLTAWVFYQVFDAAQTAKARRDGLPLPNPFGLNDLGTRLGIGPVVPYVPPPPPPQATTDTASGTAYASSPPPGPMPGSVPGSVPGSIPGTEQAAGWNPVPPSSGYPPSAPPSYAPMSQAPYVAVERHRYPIGAIVLIVIGVVLLLNTLGLFEEEWVSRAWPLILIGIGGWLLYRRTRDGNRNPGARGGL